MHGGWGSSIHQTRSLRPFFRSAKFERAAMRRLGRYLTEKEPTLKNFAEVVRELEQRRLEE